jgi:hypothetical protein
MENYYMSAQYDQIFADWHKERNALNSELAKQIKYIKS